MKYQRGIQIQIGAIWFNTEANPMIVTEGAHTRVHGTQNSTKLDSLYLGNYRWIQDATNWNAKEISVSWPKIKNNVGHKSIFGKGKMTSEDDAANGEAIEKPSISKIDHSGEWLQYKDTIDMLVRKFWESIWYHWTKLQQQNRATNTIPIHRRNLKYFAGYTHERILMINQLRNSRKYSN